MLTIRRLIPSGECAWCRKEKEVCEVALPAGAAMNLCWTDLKRAVHTGLLTSEAGRTKPPEKV